MMSLIAQQASTCWQRVMSNVLKEKIATACERKAPTVCDARVQQRFNCAFGESQIAVLECGVTATSGTSEAELSCPEPSQSETRVLTNRGRSRDCSVDVTTVVVVHLACLLRSDSYDHHWGSAGDTTAQSIQ